MAWIESHQALDSSPKLKRAARHLQVSRPAVSGHLHFLWHWALDNAFDGDLSDLDPEDIADAAEWDGDPDEFVAALTECGPGDQAGFLERDGLTADGRRASLVIHDWFEHTKHLREKREASIQANHQRWHVRRGVSEPSCALCCPAGEASDPPDDPPEIPPDSAGNPTGDPEEVPPESTDRNRPEPEPEPTGTDQPPPGGGADAPNVRPLARADVSPQGLTVEEAFEKWWDAYPKRNGKKVGKGNALTEFRKLSWEQRRRAYWGAVNLAKSDTLPKDPERFLKRSKGGKGDFPFDDWQEPDDPSVNGQQPTSGLAAAF